MSSYDAIHDNSLLNQEIPVGQKGIEQLLISVKNGSTEMKDLILNETIMLYECLECHSIFRTIEVLIKHIKEFCQLINNPTPTQSLEITQIAYHYLRESCCSMDAASLPTTDVNKENNEAGINNKSVLHSDDMDDSEEKLVIDESGFIESNDEEKLVIDELNFNKSSDDGNLEIDETSSNKDNDEENKEIFIKESSQKEQTNICGSKKRKYFVPTKVKSKEEPDLPQTNKRSIFERQSTPRRRRKRESAQNSIATLYEDPNMYVNGEGSLLHLHEIKANSNAFYQVKGQQGQPSPSILMMEPVKPVEIVRPLTEPIDDASEDTPNHINYSPKANNPKNIVKLNFNIDNNITCPFCSTRFEQLWCISQHLMNAHGKNKEQCGRIKDDILRRIKLKRDSERITKFKCIFCPKKFFNSAQKNMHMKICSNKKIKQFAKQSKNNLRESSILYKPPSLSEPSSNGSQMNILSRPKRNKIKKMDADFVDSQTFKFCSNGGKEGSEPKQTSKVSPKSSPNNTTTTNNTTTKKSVKEIEKQVLQFISPNDLNCKKCSKVFSTFSNLRRHAATHIGWYRYHCKACKKKFYNRSECRDHVIKYHDSISPEKFVEDLPTKAAFSKRNNHVLKSNCSTNADLKSTSPYKKVSKKLSL